MFQETGERTLLVPLCTLPSRPESSPVVLKLLPV